MPEHSDRPRLQNQEYRYGVTYTPDYYTVNYTSHNFQTFLANESCAGCTLDDNLITINRCVTAAKQGLRQDTCWRIGAPLLCGPQTAPLDNGAHAHEPRCWSVLLQGILGCPTSVQGGGRALDGLCAFGAYSDTGRIHRGVGNSACPGLVLDSLAALYCTSWSSCRQRHWGAHWKGIMVADHDGK